MTEAEALTTVQQWGAKVRELRADRTSAVRSAEAAVVAISTELGHRKRLEFEDKQGRQVTGPPEWQNVLVVTTEAGGFAVRGPWPASRAPEGAGIVQAVEAESEAATRWIAEMTQSNARLRAHFVAKARG